MEMGDGADIGPRLEDFQVDRQFARQFGAGAELVSLKIDLDKLVRARMLRQVVRRHQHPVRIGGTGADMTESVDKSAAIKKLPGLVELIGEDGVRIDHERLRFLRVIGKAQMSLS